NLARLELKLAPAQPKFVTAKLLLAHPEEQFAQRELITALLEPISATLKAIFTQQSPKLPPTHQFRAPKELKLAPTQLKLAPGQPGLAPWELILASWELILASWEPESAPFELQPTPREPPPAPSQLM